MDKALTRSDVPQSTAISEMEVLKSDMTSVWSMSRDLRFEATEATAKTTATLDILHTAGPSSPPHPLAAGSHAQDAMEQEPKPKSPSPPLLNYHSHSSTPQDCTGDPHIHSLPTHTPPPSQHNSPAALPSDADLPMKNNTSVDTVTVNPVAMETETVAAPQVDQSSSTTKEPSTPWFSLTPRVPCETKPTVAMTAVVQNGVGEGQFQLVATTPGGQQPLAPQQQILQPPGVMQYYITPSGAITAAPTQQVQMGYALIGNTLVPQQYLAAPQQQLIVSQGGIQYVVGGTGGLMGLGGVAVVPQSGLGGAQGVVQAISGGGAALQAIGEGGAVIQAVGDGGNVVQAIGGGGAVVVGGAAATIGTTSDSVEGVKAIDGGSSVGVVEEDSSHRMHDSSSHQKAVVDTTVAMDTATSSTIAMETRQESGSSSAQPASPVKEGEVLYRQICKNMYQCHYSWKT